MRLKITHFSCISKTKASYFSAIRAIGITFAGNRFHVSLKTTTFAHLYLILYMHKISGLPSLLLALLFPLLAACDSNDRDIVPDSPATARRTVLIYMAGQNSLGSSRWNASDSTEIAAGRIHINKDDRLLVFSDSRDGAKIYEVAADERQPRILRRFAGEVCSTSPDVLADVLKWVKENRPATEYGLVMWSHADGWIPPSKDTRAHAVAATPRPFSFGIDDGLAEMGTDNGPQMAIEEMAEAIEKAEIQLRYIFFDACLMQNLEVAYALRHVTDFVVGGPISIPACGANYTHQLESGLFADDPANIITTYRNDAEDPQQADKYDDFGIVLSVLRTEYLDDLAATLHDALPFSEAIGRTSVDMNGILAYQAYTWRYYYRPDNFDAAAALRRLLPEPHRERVLSLLDRTIHARAATAAFWRGPGYLDNVDVPENFSGVSMFVPQQKYTENDHGIHGNLNHAFTKTEWYNAAGWHTTGW